MVHGFQKTKKLNYLISTQIHGRRKCHFLSAQDGEFTFQSYFVQHVFSIYGFGVISRKSSVLIIGGRCDDNDSSLIAKYTIDNWEHVGNLQEARNGHRAIANDDQMFVVGGWGTR